MVLMDESTFDFEALEGMVDPALVAALQGPLGKLTKDVEILLFVAPGCPNCPHQLRATAALAMASERVVVEVVEVEEVVIIMILLNTIGLRIQPIGINFSMVAMLLIVKLSQ